MNYYWPIASKIPTFHRREGVEGPPVAHNETLEAHGILQVRLHGRLGSSDRVGQRYVKYPDILKVNGSWTCR